MTYNMVDNDQHCEGRSFNHTYTVSVQRPVFSESLRPQIRSSVLKLLSGRLSSTPTFPVNEEAVINLIIMEYFEWIGYDSSAKMLRKESRIDYLSIIGREMNLTACLWKKLSLGTSENALPSLLVLISDCRSPKKGKSIVSEIRV